MNLSKYHVRTIRYETCHFVTPDSPFNKWKTMERQEADKRSYYADQLAMLLQRSLFMTWSIETI